MNHRDQNRLLIAASYIFYGAWDWRFLILLILSTCVDYKFAQKIESAESPAARKTYLILSLAISLTILGFFKYFNFFSSNLQLLMESLGQKALWPTLNVLL